VLAADCLIKGPSPWPCMACGQDCDEFLTWRPSRECLTNEFHCSVGKTVVVLFPLSTICESYLDNGVASWSALYARVLASLRAQHQIPIK
jgi:hypothetical protein